MAETEYQHVPRGESEMLSLLNDLDTPLEGNIHRDIVGSLFELILRSMVDAGYTDVQVEMAKGRFKDLASRLDASDDELTSTTVQLAQKVDKGNVSVSDINKNLGKLDQTYMSDEFLQQMAGNTPINAVPADGGVTTEKLADKSVTNAKLDSDYTYRGASSNVDLDDLVEDGTFLYITNNESTVLNAPPLRGSLKITVSNANSFVEQEVVSLTDFTGAIFRRQFRKNIDGSLTFKSGWKNMNGGAIFPNLSSSDHINDYIEEGSVVGVDVQGLPNLLTGKSVMITNKYLYSDPANRSNANIIQTLTELTTSSQPLKFYRIMTYDQPSDSYTRGPFKSVGEERDLGHIESGNLDYLESGETTLVSSDDANFQNKPFSGSGNVSTFKSGNGWRYQLAYALGSETLYFRNYRFNGEGQPITFSSDWVRLNASDKTMRGKHVVNLGDSIFGNTRGVNSVSNRISEITGATVTNSGFGGTKAAQSTLNLDPFSLYRLVTEIVKDSTDTTRWTLQDDTISRFLGGQINWVPAYFEQQLNDLKSVNWSEVDYVTIALGTNDYTTGTTLDNPDDDYDTTTYAGALRYAVKELMTKYPQLKVMICTPLYRFWWEDGEVVEDSDTRQYADQTLPDFVEKAKEVAKEFKIPALDNYYELGINRFNRSLYFNGSDGTHPNAEGNKKLGSKIGAALMSKF